MGSKCLPPAHTHTHDIRRSRHWLRRLALDLTTKENEVELLATKFYTLHIISFDKFHEKSVCHKTKGVHLFRFDTLNPYDRLGIHAIELHKVERCLSGHKYCGCATQCIESLF